jgi:hypothetical protein
MPEAGIGNAFYVFGIQNQPAVKNILSRISSQNSNEK